MTCRVAPLSVGRVVGAQCRAAARASMSISVNTTQQHRKASILLALRAVCCKIAVGGQQALHQTRDCAADSHYSRKGV